MKAEQSLQVLECTRNINLKKWQVYSLELDIRKHAAEIIRGLVQKAIEGGAVQAKFLFDFAGLRESPPQESKGESLLDLMRRELRLEEPPEGTVE